MRGATPSATVTLPFTYPHILTLLPDEAQMNNHQASYLVPQVRLIFVFNHDKILYSSFINRSYI